jgi:dephospho-CoA kinase
VASGLPGTGKSFFCRKLADKLSFLILASNALRKILFPSPSIRKMKIGDFSLRAMFSSRPQYDAEAKWEVYNKTKTRRERISRNHLVVDTAQDITAVIDRIVRSVEE